MKIKNEPCTYPYQYSEPGHDSSDILNFFDDFEPRDSYKKKCRLLMKSNNNVQLESSNYDKLIWANKQVFG